MILGLAVPTAITAASWLAAWPIFRAAERGAFPERVLPVPEVVLSVPVPDEPWRGLV